MTIETTHNIGDLVQSARRGARTRKQAWNLKSQIIDKPEKKNGRKKVVQSAEHPSGEMVE